MLRVNVIIIIIFITDPVMFEFNDIPLYNNSIISKSFINESSLILSCSSIDGHSGLALNSTNGPISTYLTASQFDTPLTLPSSGLIVQVSTVGSYEVMIEFSGNITSPDVAGIYYCYSRVSGTTTSITINHGTVCCCTHFTILCDHMLTRYKFLIVLCTIHDSDTFHSILIHYNN